MTLSHDMNTESHRTPDHGFFHDPVAEDESNPTVEQIIDYLYMPPSPIDSDALARSFDPRNIDHDKMRQITMESLSENGRIVGGPHRLPLKPILFADDEAREKGLRIDGTQYDGPSGTVLWYYLAHMAGPRPILPTSSIFRFRHSLSAGNTCEEIGIDPLETVGGGDIPAWRGKEKTPSKKESDCFDPVQKNKKAGPKKRKQ